MGGPGRPGPWTEERIERAKALLAEGLSAAQIAAELGNNLTRSAVIGKLHRLGLSGGGSQQQPPRQRRTYPQPKAPPVPRRVPSTNAGPPSWWTTDRIAELKRLLGAGKTIAEIGAIMGKEPSAVYSKMQTEGLKSANGHGPRNKYPEGWRARSGRAEPGQPKPPKPVYEEAPALPPASKRLSLLELTNEVCHWPIGDPASTDFAFCGADKTKAKPGPYCSFHRKIAYVQASTPEERAKARRQYLAEAA